MPRRKRKIWQGEQACGDCLRQLGLQVTPQFRLPCFLEGKHPRWSYDFCFTYGPATYILEYDGNQHFEETPIFHRSTQRFRQLQARDIHKTAAALLQGYKVIRIDAKHTPTDQIPFHVRQAINLTTTQLYVSHVERYAWLLSGKVRTEWVTNYGTPAVQLKLNSLGLTNE